MRKKIEKLYEDNYHKRHYTEKEIFNFVRCPDCDREMTTVCMCKIKHLDPLTMLDQIIESFPDDDFLKPTGEFDSAIIGVASDFTVPRLIYSVSKCLKILEKEMSVTDAEEHFSKNISGGYLGEKTPIWCWDNFLDI